MQSGPFSSDTTSGGSTASLFAQGSCISSTQPTQSSTAATTTTGLFGKTIEKQKDSSVYTPMENLTQEEIEVYRTCKFVLGKIPEKPPPIEFC